MKKQFFAAFVIAISMAAAIAQTVGAGRRADLINEIEAVTRSYVSLELEEAMKSKEVCQETISKPYFINTGDSERFYLVPCMVSNMRLKPVLTIEQAEVYDSMEYESDNILRAIHSYFNDRDDEFLMSIKISQTIGNSEVSYIKVLKSE